MQKDAAVAEKIARQYEEEPLTDFASVDSQTPLEALNLNWREKDLPEKKRTKHVHRLHPYMGKFIPQMVEIFLRKYHPSFVYDPFCGSGTTMVEAKALGIPSAGTDISVFNVLLSKVKSADYDVDSVEKEANDILARLERYKKEFSNDPEVEQLFTTDNEYLNSWFADRSRQELLCYRRLIEDYEHQDLFRVILSRSARSARLVPHHNLEGAKEPQVGPYECRKHSKTCTPVQEAYKFLTRYTRDTLRRIKEYTAVAEGAPVEVFHGDSRKVSLPDNVDFVFTSPPYIGLIDYHDQHKYAYELLGLENNEEKEIGPAKKGQSQEAKEEYIQGINDVLLHTRDSMTKDGLMLIVINDKFNLYDPSAVGFKEIGKVDRHVNRRTGRRGGAFYESILIWQKD